MASPKFEKIFNEVEAPSKQEGKPKYYLDDDISGLQFTDVSRMIKVNEDDIIPESYTYSSMQFCYTGRFDADLPPVRLIEIALIAEHYEMRDLS